MDAHYTYPQKLACKKQSSLQLNGCWRFATHIVCEVALFFNENGICKAQQIGIFYFTRNAYAQSWIRERVVIHHLARQAERHAPLGWLAFGLQCILGSVFSHPCLNRYCHRVVLWQLLWIAVLFSMRLCSMVLHE